MPGGRESVPPDASRCVKKCADYTPKLKIDPEKFCVEDDPFLLDPFGIPQFLRGYLKLYGCIRLCVVIALCSLKQYLTYFYLMVSRNTIPYQVAVLQIRTLNAFTFQ